MMNRVVVVVVGGGGIGIGIGGGNMLSLLLLWFRSTLLSSSAFVVARCLLLFFGTVLHVASVALVGLLVQCRCLHRSRRRTQCPRSKCPSQSRFGRPPARLPVCLGRMPRP